MRTRWRKRAGDGSHSATTIPIHLSSPAFIEYQPPSSSIGMHHSHVMNIRFGHPLLRFRIYTEITWIFSPNFHTLSWSAYSSFPLSRRPIGILFGERRPYCLSIGSRLSCPDLWLHSGYRRGHWHWRTRSQVFCERYTIWHETRLVHRRVLRRQH